MNEAYLDEENGLFVFNVRYPYEIDLDRIKKPEKLLGWVAHLSQKNWIQTRHLRTFVCAVSDYRGWDIHGL